MREREKNTKFPKVGVGRGKGVTVKKSEDTWFFRETEPIVDFIFCVCVCMCMCV